MGSTQVLQKLLFTSLVLLPLLIVQRDVAAQEFTRERDTGILSISEQGKSFEINTIGGNCHTCTLSGTLHQGIGVVKDWGETCRIRLARRGDSITVKALTADSCRNYCGMRADFNGRYSVPPRGCTASARKRRYAAAIRQYKARTFTASEATLGTLLTECSDFMHYVEKDRVRNDLALAQLRQGHVQQCLATLNQTMAGEYADEASLKDAFPPCDYDNYVAVARSTWFNQRLCSQPTSK